MPLTTWMGKWPPDVSVAEAKAKPAPKRTRTKSSVKSSRQELARKPSG
jgi:hypothetical protein